MHDGSVLRFVIENEKYMWWEVDEEANVWNGGVYWDQYVKRPVPYNLWQLTLVLRKYIFMWCTDVEGESDPKMLTKNL